MNKVLIVTGASRGIGAATARLAAQRGHAVIVNYRSDAAGAASVAAEIHGAGGSAVAVAGDIAREDHVIALFDAAESEFGPVTGLVNNAGILETQLPLARMSVERLQRIFATNVIGSMLCAREAVRRMTARGNGGAIVNVSSMAARLGGPNEYVDYAASKGAIDTLTVGLARELGTLGIRVNAVRPGLIHTRMHASGGEPGRIERLRGGVPMQRGGTPEEVAEAIVWLLSDAASYVTGTCIDVSGGR